MLGILHLRNHKPLWFFTVPFFISGRFNLVPTESAWEIPEFTDFRCDRKGL